ncbi:YopX family protein [uncultured Ruminococcus sp.]|uniref:YopX family protein n=1 Tax=uncultured Ruminococcus sp. TaxID=165186 RepID=UPI00266EDBAF|nr:YopX family protein [uncultured Ruminococcus sp.]
MMREILFRGKFGNEWKYGFLSIEPKGLVIKEPYKNESSNVWHIDADTVGQYTDLTDKNGTKIFEGDIVKYGDTVHNVVFEQRNGTAYFGLVYSTLETLSFGYYQDLKQIEVIGNIYDNPELVGDENNEKGDNSRKRI